VNIYTVYIIYTIYILYTYNIYIYIDCPIFHMAIFYCQSTRYPKIFFSPGDFHRPIVGTSPCLGPISTCGSDQPCMASTDEIAENLRDFGTTRSIHENSNIKTHQNLCLKSWKPENHGENIKELPSWKVVSICFGLTRWLFSS